MNITVITAAPFSPVTLADVYSHLRMDPEDSPPTHPDDDMLRRHIATSTADCEKRTRRAFVQQRLRVSVAGFGCGIALRPPLLSVDRVQYFDGDNQLQTVSPSDYYVTDDLPPQVRFVTAWAAPMTYCRPDAVRVEYIAGYAPEGSPTTEQAEYAANVPSQLKDAILMGVELLYDTMTPEQRTRIERSQESLLSGFKVPLIA